MIVNSHGYLCKSPRKGVVPGMSSIFLAKYSCLQLKLNREYVGRRFKIKVEFIEDAE